MIMMNPNCKIQQSPNIDELALEMGNIDFANITILPPLPKKPKIEIFKSSRDKAADSATGLF